MNATPDKTLADAEQLIANLQRQLAEAREQQAATAEVLQVINASPGDLAPVFDAALERGLRLCEAAFGQLWTYDGDWFEMVAWQGMSPEFVEFLSGRHQPGPGTLHGRLLAGEDVLHLVDMMDDELYRAGHSYRKKTVELGGARSSLSVALRKDKKLLGILIIYRQAVRPFTDKQIELLQNFAAQVVIAMENARLLTEAREALEQQTATAEVLQVINASPGDLTPVFDAMLEKALNLCNAAFGVLSTFDGEVLRPVALRNVPEAYRVHLTDRAFVLDGATFLGQTIFGRQVVHIADNAAQEPYRNRVPMAVAAVELGGARTFVHVPLIKDDIVLGLLTAFRQEVRPFTDKQITLLQNFATQAVIAIENARLLTETREALEQQTATAEVLGVINASPGDLAPVFDAILDKAHALCGATAGNLAIYKDGLFHVLATHGFPEQVAALVRHPLPPNPNTQALLDGARYRQVEDIRAIGLSSHYQIMRALVEHTEVRTVLFVPLRKDGSLRGFITANRPEVRLYSEREIALLENFAAQAVIAMENARLLDELRERTDQVAELNRGLEARVAEQVEELGRVGRLKRFLAPQLAELIVSQGNEQILESHRREIVVVFCDLRGYTSFTETAEPEEVLDFLRDYHGALGPLVSQFEGTLDQFSGDGIMVFFNDPVPIPDAAARAINMAVAMREAAGTLIADWRERGRDLGFGAGVAQGYATLGQIGFSERSGYTAIGTVCNVAARLCAEAKDGQILLSQRVNVALRGSVVTEQVGALALKGLTQPVVAYNVPLAATQPAFRVIEGGPQNH